jgi:hypothetical protein
MRPSPAPQIYLPVTSATLTTAGFNTNHNAAPINTPPYTCAMDNGSPSNNAPHNTPNGGIKKVVVIDLTGPTELSKRK